MLKPGVPGVCLRLRLASCRDRTYVSPLDGGRTYHYTNETGGDRNLKCESMFTVRGPLWRETGPLVCFDGVFGSDKRLSRLRLFVKLETPQRIIAAGAQEKSHEPEDSRQAYYSISPLGRQLNPSRGWRLGQGLQ